jgi:hypothetical protein
MDTEGAGAPPLRAMLGYSGGFWSTAATARPKGRIRYSIGDRYEQISIIFLVEEYAATYREKAAAGVQPAVLAVTGISK